MVDHVMVNVGERWAVVTAPRAERSRVAHALRHVVRDPKLELRTVTGVQHGLGFRVPVGYAADVHSALFGAPAPQEEVVDTHVPEVVESAPTGDVEGDTVPNEAPAPPRTGKGSGVAAWREFLATQGITHPEDATRDELVQLWETQ